METDISRRRHGNETLDPCQRYDAAAPSGPVSGVVERFLGQIRLLVNGRGVRGSSRLEGRQSPGVVELLVLDGATERLTESKKVPGKITTSLEIIQNKMV